MKVRKAKMSQFVQLSKEDCQYLLDLIQVMDSDTAYTERQRGYTVPKLQKIQHNAKETRLAFQDVDYLLDLMEDDTRDFHEQQREMTRAAVLDIQALQNARFEETRDIESQRELRRARLNPERALNEKFGEAR
jgi:hypothetical protein